MKTLLDERFAPTTSRVGFLELPFEEALAGLREWSEWLYTGVRVERFDGTFPEVFLKMEPLVYARRPRQLLVEAGRWTAYFDNSALGSDPSSAIGALTRRLKCQGLAVVSSAASVAGVGQRGRDGQVALTLFGPLSTEWLNHVRALNSSERNGRVEFEMTGLEQWFEEPERYRSRRVRDRFNSEILERYCRALGIEVFTPDFYGPQCAVVERNLISRQPPPDFSGRSDVRVTVEDAGPWREASYADMQRTLGIVPGAAREVKW